LDASSVQEKNKVVQVHDVTMRREDRCPWGEDPLMNEYHDREWGVPVHEDRALFEFLILDCMQAGLSWITILHKREAFRKAFDGFDIEKVSKYDQGKVEELLQNRGIVRNRLKIEAAIINANCVLQVQRELGSLDVYLWGFVDGRTVQNRWRSFKDIPTETPESKRMSDGLKGRGFRFVGPTICYAFMQAVGMVNDHLVTCYRHQELER
jgi:DNA-3-methyladenine glycosylase I